MKKTLFTTLVALIALSNYAYGAQDLEYEKKERLTREAYDRLKEEIKVSHILIRTKTSTPDDTLVAYEKALEIYKRLDKEDFAKVAKEVSEDTGTAEKGGEVGYITGFQTVLPFENMAFATPVGKISQPVRSQFGYHIIKVQDRRPSQGTVHVAHIMKIFPANANNIAKDSLKKALQTVYEKLLAGCDFETLAKTESEHTHTANKGGEFGWFGTGGSGAGENFEKAAFALNIGEFSKPTESSFGYHIIKLLEKKELEPYDEKKADIQKKLHFEEKNEYKYNINSFSTFAHSYIEPKINEWQKKDEFETTAEWQQRVNEKSRNEKINQLTKEAEKKYIADKSKDLKIKTELGAYDADNGVFLVTSDFGNLLIPVPRTEAQAFKTNWNSHTKTPKYFIENDKLALAEMTFASNGKTYKYSNQASLNYTVAKIDYDFAPIDINVAANNQPVQQGKQNISTTNISAGNLSDVAKNIPITNIANDKTFAVIFANENYRRESKVEFAQNDGETFKKYCMQTFGIPDKNIHFVTDATLNDIRGEINWISKVTNAYNGEASIIFYYAGHGILDESSKTAYLLPTDGYGSDVNTGYKLEKLYSQLGALQAKSVLVFMDACFSGAARSGDMMASARGVAIKASTAKPSGNVVVFSAAQGDETAFPYKEKGHGMFTYFLLKKLQESKGNVTLGELSKYITDNVSKQSIVINSKSQTPTVIPSENLANWQNLRLK